MKFKVYEPDNPKIMGGWNKVGTVEAKDEKEALSIAKKKYGDKVMVKAIK